MSTVKLTDEQQRFFHENGFLEVPQISNPDELARMRRAYDRIFSQKAGREEGNEFDLAGTDEEDKEAALPQILQPGKYAEELRDTQAEANARAIAQQLLCPDGSEEVRGGPAHAIFKPAHHGAATPWHQDEAYSPHPENDSRNVSIWMPLQEATLENGCMQFIPGSHLQEILPHRSINNDPRIHGLEVTPEAGVDFSTAVACPLQAGGVTIHPGRTLHYTGANHSAIPRRALIFMFSLSSLPRNDNRRFPWNETKQTARLERAAKQ